MIKNKPYIIAEIGINHEGKLSNIKKLIYSAKKAGADAVKFQLFKAETLSKKNSNIKKFFYSKNKKETLFQMWKRLEIDKKKLNQINKLCKILKIDLIFSIFDTESQKKLSKIDYKYIKIASSDINDFPLLKILKTKKKKFIISTGMANENEILKIINYIKKKNLYLLHCVSLYPCPKEKININRMISLSKKFKLQVGFSDHSIGVDACLLALSKGANIIEKHFTLNKKSDGPDHALSADENDLKIICDFAKNVKHLKGSGKIAPTKEELKIKKIARKSIYIKRNIKKGEKFSIKNLEVRRPESFIEPNMLKLILKKKSLFNLNVGDPLKIKYVENFNIK